MCILFVLSYRRTIYSLSSIEALGVDIAAFSAISAEKEVIVAERGSVKSLFCQALIDTTINRD